MPPAGRPLPKMLLCACSLSRWRIMVSRSSGVIDMPWSDWPSEFASSDEQLLSRGVKSSPGPSHTLYSGWYSELFPFGLVKGFYTAVVFHHGGSQSIDVWSHAVLYVWTVIVLTVFTIWPA